MAKSKNLADKAYKTLREEIILGKLVPGDRLPEIALAARLAMSRTPVREALNHLERDGLVSFAGSVAKVRSYSMEEVSQLYELRELVEVHAAEEAAERIGAEALEKLEFCCNEFDRLQGELEKPGLPPETVAALGSEIALNDFNFHMIVISQSANSFIRKLSLDLRIAMLSVFHTGVTYPFRAEERDKHRTMFAALKRRDAGTVRDLFLDHIRSSRRSVEQMAGHHVSSAVRDSRSILHEGISEFD